MFAATEGGDRQRATWATKWTTKDGITVTKEHRADGSAEDMGHQQMAKAL